MAETHLRLGHLAPEAIRKMLKDGTITGCWRTAMTDEQVD